MKEKIVVNVVHDVAGIDISKTLRNKKTAAHPQLAQQHEIKQREAKRLESERGGK